MNHAFHQQACFETTYVLIIKSGFFEPSDILALHNCHSLLLHLLRVCVHLQNYDFLWLAQYNTTWGSREHLSANKAYAFLACLLHYNLSVVCMTCFLGNNCTGAYHDIPATVALLCLHGIAKTLIYH